MTKNLLIELGVEELPAYVVTSSAEQFKNRMETFLRENRLSFDYIQTFSTPRRLAVRVNGLSDVQTDLTEDFKGPSKKIALDADGNFTKAAQGFVRGKGLTTDAIEFRHVKGEEYVYITKHEPGKAARDVLTAIPQILSEMTFPVNMHWASNRFEYIRPVHTLTVLLDDELISLDFLDIHSGRTSRGHRFLGHDIEIANADSYEEDLRQVFVIADAKERQDMIINQIKAIEQKNHVQVEIDVELLNEVLNLVEYPTAFMGNFDSKYLDIPEEVLVTSMKNHQRYFVVRDSNGHLMPNFVSVRNGNSDYIDNVIKGNEKVLVARLEDGEFFWREDQKLRIDELVAKLDHVTFHEKIGSLAEHMKRSQKIAMYLADKSNISVTDRQNLLRATEIYKFDLLTGMVGEFDELQGVMGEKYALIAGENSSVATAIREHYLPDSATSNLPETTVGALLALSDKLDTLLSFFSVGLIPSGSNDPYALRRATAGIVRIMDCFNLNIPIDTLLDDLYALSLDNFAYQHKAEVMDFILARVDKMMSSTVSKDIKEAVLASSNVVISDMMERAEAIVVASKTVAYKSSIESLSRVLNLAEKMSVDATVDETLFENSEEKMLLQATQKLSLTGDVATKLEQLFALSPTIDTFFDHTMVVVDDEVVKHNRLALLNQLAKKIKTFAAFNKLNTKS